jgi:hypothetical protein
MEMFWLSPDLYLPIYYHSMLALVMLTALIYAQDDSTKGVGLNKFMIWAVSMVIIIFLGTRPISGVFVDMTTYAESFNVAQNTGRELYPDWGFDMLLRFCSNFTNVEVFFFICMLLYVLPIILGVKRVHGNWAYAGFLAFAGSFSFYSYGVNGIRNGIATSLLVAAFAFWDRKLIMALLMVAAWSMHQSVILPIFAFFLATMYARPLAYVILWISSLGLSLLLGGRLSDFLAGLVVSTEDDRLSIYTSSAGFGADKGGFRLDFVLYSIVPLIISYMMAGPLVRKDSFYRRLVCSYLLTNSFWLIVMYAAYSNRFAYLSWFIMPWLVVYPFIPTNRSNINRVTQSEAPHTSLLGLALLAHFAFTYIMGIFVYPNRGS